MTEPVTKPAPGPKTLILHIGDHKTGSTSIQSALFKGQIRLQDSKILFPGGLNHNYLREHFAAYAKTGEEKKGQPGKPDITTLAKRIENTDAQFCVLSGEAFEGFNQEAFQEIVMTRFAPLVDDIRVIAYIRPHSGRILSAYAEQTKIGWFHGPLRGFVKKATEGTHFHYATRLETWKTLFKDRFIARPMIRSELVNGSVIDDFAATAFAGADWQVTPGEAANESLSLRDLVMVRHLQAQCRDATRGARHGLGWDLARIAGSMPSTLPAEKPQMPRALARLIRDTYREDAGRIDALHFGDKGLFSAALDTAIDQAPAKPQSFDPKDHFSPEELRNLSVIAETLSAMLQDSNRPWPGFFRARRAGALGRAAGQGPGQGPGQGKTPGKGKGRKPGKGPKKHDPGT